MLLLLGFLVGLVGCVLVLVYGIFSVSVMYVCEFVVMVDG